MRRRSCSRGVTLLLALSLSASLLGCPDISVTLNVRPDVLDFGATKDTLTLRVSKNASARPMAPVIGTSTDPWIIVGACENVEANCVSYGPWHVRRIPVRLNRDHMSSGVNVGSVVVSCTGVPSQTIEVVAENQLAVDFTVSKRAPDVGEEVQFINKSAIAVDPTTLRGLEWDFGDGTNVSKDLNPKHTYRRLGIYTISLKIMTADRTFERVRKDYVSVGATPPEAGFDVQPSNVFPGDVVRFMDTSKAGTSPITGWSWNFGDGTGATEQNPAHVYAEEGLYSVSLTVSDAYKSSTAVQENAVIVRGKVPPTANFRVKTIEPIVNQPVGFEDLSEPGSAPIDGYLWNFGDGFFSYEQHPQHRYARAGDYDVSLTVTTAHGTHTKSGVTVSPVGVPPEADFTVPEGVWLTTDDVPFADASTAGTNPIQSWAWNFGDPASGGANESALRNPTHQFSGPGSYTVTLTVTTLSGTDTVTKADVVHVFAPTALDAYVRKPEGVYSYRLEKTASQPGYTVHTLEMLSQNWRDRSEVSNTLWRHWLVTVSYTHLTLPTKRIV